LGSSPLSDPRQRFGTTGDETKKDIVAARVVKLKSRNENHEGKQCKNASNALRTSFAIYFTPLPQAALRSIGVLVGPDGDGAEGGVDGVAAGVAREAPREAPGKQERCLARWCCGRGGEGGRLWGEGALIVSAFVHIMSTPFYEIKPILPTLGCWLQPTWRVQSGEANF